MKNSKTARKYLGLLLTLIFIIFLVFYIKENIQTFAKIKNISLPILALVFIANIAYIYLNGIFLKIVLEPFKIKLEEPFLLSAGSSFINLIAPFRAGAGARAIYLKKKYELSYSNFTSSLFGNYVISFLLSSITALIIFGILYFQSGIFNGIITLIFLGIFSFCILVLLNIKFETKRFQIINNIIEGWKKIKTHPKTILKLILNNIFGIIVGVATTYLIFESLNIQINIFQVIYFSVMGVLATFINITPGSLGITEGIFAISSQVLGFDPAIGVLVALTIRAINSSILIIIGPIANYLLYKNLKK